MFEKKIIVGGFSLVELYESMGRIIPYMQNKIHV
jgi:hypothetical protein